MSQNTMSSQNKHSTIDITGLTHDGRGIGKLNNKTIFIDNAIPGDIVEIHRLETGDKYDTAQLKNIEQPSEDRTQPFCDYYKNCGGCQLQHMSIAAQRDWKNRNFTERLSQAINTKHLKIEAPLIGEDQSYRRRARLGLVISKKDKQARLGFRQKNSNELIDIQQCPVLTPALNALILGNRTELLSKASRSYKEVNLVDVDSGSYLQLESTTEVENSNKALPSYQLNDMKMHFPANGFVQVNADINQQMVNQAIEWLELDNKHRVLDLFCGVGNFTLPIAQQAKAVVGIEGLSELTETAKFNAQQNQLENITFFKADLFKDSRKSEWFRQQKYQRILLDPGRQGAFEISKQLHLLKADLIVYVSCNPATLIRDIKELEKQGYLAHKACLMDMFPHTTHTEVMVQLKKTKQPKKTDRKVFKF